MIWIYITDNKEMNREVTADIGFSFDNRTHSGITQSNIIFAQGSRCLSSAEPQRDISSNRYITSNRERVKGY